MKHLAATNFLIAVAAAPTKQEYDTLVANLTTSFEQLLTNYAQHHAPREIEGDPFPGITKSLNDRVEEALTAKLDALRREFKALLEEAAVIHRSRSEFFLRVQKSLEVALTADNKNNVHNFRLNEFKFDVLITMPTDVVIPE